MPIVNVNVGEGKIIPYDTNKPVSIGNSKPKRIHNDLDGLSWAIHYDVSHIKYITDKIVKGIFDEETIPVALLANGLSKTTIGQYGDWNNDITEIFKGMDYENIMCNVSSVIYNSVRSTIGNYKSQHQKENIIDRFKNSN